MTKQELIDAAAETLEKRAEILRRGLRAEMQRWWIDEQLHLCGEGVFAVKVALSSPADPPPLAKLGQGTSETCYRPVEENEDGNP